MTEHTSAETREQTREQAGEQRPTKEARRVEAAGTAAFDLLPDFVFERVRLNAEYTMKVHQVFTKKKGGASLRPSGERFHMYRLYMPKYLVGHHGLVGGKPVYMSIEGDACVMRRSRENESDFVVPLGEYTTKRVGQKTYTSFAFVVPAAIVKALGVDGKRLAVMNSRKRGIVINFV